MYDLHKWFMLFPYCCRFYLDDLQMILRIKPWLAAKLFPKWTWTCHIMVTWLTSKTLRVRITAGFCRGKCQWAMGRRQRPGQPNHVLKLVGNSPRKFWSVSFSTDRASQPLRITRFGLASVKFTIASPQAAFITCLWCQRGINIPTESKAVQVLFNPGSSKSGSHLEGQIYEIINSESESWEWRPTTFGGNNK